MTEKKNFSHKLASTSPPSVKLGSIQVAMIDVVIAYIHLTKKKRRKRCLWGLVLRLLWMLLLHRIILSIYRIVIRKKGLKSFLSQIRLNNQHREFPDIFFFNNKKTKTVTTKTLIAIEKANMNQEE